MSPKSLLATVLCICAAYVAGSQSIGAHGAQSGPAASIAVGASSVVGGAPKGGDSFRITFHNDGQTPTVEGVTTNEKTGERYWSGPQDPMIPAGKTFEETIAPFLDPSSEQEIKIVGFTWDKPAPPTPGKHTFNPPWNTHCHKTIYIPNPVVVHC
jgi:hypothetical protein